MDEIREGVKETFNNMFRSSFTNLSHAWLTGDFEAFLECLIPGNGCYLLCY
jgi:hypothetical protein